jgi:hypothetical protein
VGCGLAKGDGGSFGPSGCPFVLGWMCKTGEHASLAWDAVPPSIEAAVRLAGACASFGDVCACAGLVGGTGRCRDSLACPFALVVMSEHVLFARGAVSPVIEAAAVLVDVRSGLANTKTSRDDVGASCMRTSFEGVTGLSGEHDAGLGLSKGDRGLVGRKSLALGTGPIDSSMFVAQSNVMFAA